MLSAAAWFFFTGRRSKQRFLVDTGAASASFLHFYFQTGWIRRRLNFGLRTFFVTFLLAAVYRPILSAYGLLVGRQVLDLKSLKPLSKPPAATAGDNDLR
jgi:hypothetical protein